MAGIDGAIKGVGCMSNDIKRQEYNRTIGSHTQMNAYTAALAPIPVAAGIVPRAVDTGELSPRANCRIIHVHEQPNRFSRPSSTQQAVRTSNRRKDPPTGKSSESVRQPRDLCVGSGVLDL